MVATGSVRGAAQRLLVSQPGVSAALASLQREVGVPLVVRAGRGLDVTPAGVVFARQARQMLRLLDDAKLAASETLDPARGRVRLAAVTTAGEHVAPRFLATFRAPLSRSRTVPRGRQPRPGLGATCGTGDRPGHRGAAPRGRRAHHDGDPAQRPPPRRRRTRQAERAVVTLEELARQTLLLREPGSGTRSTAEELFSELGIAPRATLTVGSNGSIRESVHVGLGITLISRDAVARELEGGTLEEWRCPSMPRHRAWYLAARAGEELAATAALFLTHLATDDAVPTADRFHLASGA
ncbi:MAG: LysR substrate-binding domain-containing protein [Actinomycetota bacterium]|nr:LysR substrate-binding domain-containing protein [Actinomycetota bacterium]